MTITYCHLLLSHNLLNFLIMRMWSNVTLPSITINDIQYLTTYELSWSSMFGESLFAMKWWTAWLSLSKAAIEMESIILSCLHTFEYGTFYLYGLVQNGFGDKLLSKKLWFELVLYYKHEVNSDFSQFFSWLCNDLMAVLLNDNRWARLMVTHCRQICVIQVYYCHVVCSHNLTQ